MHHPLAVTLLVSLGAARPAAAAAAADEVGRPADIAPGAYLYRRDRPADRNPPESWIGVMQYAGLPYDRPVDVAAPAVKAVLCSLLWEEVRPVRRVELTWPADAAGRPAPEDIAVTFFDARDDTAHTWWNPRTLADAGRPEVSADGRTWAYAIPADTWGVTVAARGGKDPAAWAVPGVRAFGPDAWKDMEVEIEWGFEPATSSRGYGGWIEAYDGVPRDVRPLDGDAGTAMRGPAAWESGRKGDGRRGVRLGLLYIGTSRWRRVWPYHAQPEDVARTIVTVWTESGSFSFLASDLELGPILAPEYGFFVRAVRTGAAAAPVPPERLAAPQPVMLGDKTPSLPGVPKVRGWSRNGMPWLGVNPEGEPGTAGTVHVPARSAACHPAPDLDVAAEWRSPIRAKVRVEGRVAMGDTGAGVGWWVARTRAADRRVLARGEIGSGGGQEFPAGAGEKARAELGAIDVEPGDGLALVVHARGGVHTCDTTIVRLAVTEIGGAGRSWDLAADLLDDVGAGNPHADRLGNAGVWRFYALAADPAVLPAAASEPPIALESAATSAKEFVRELTAKDLRTIRRRVRDHAEQTWEGAVGAMFPGAALPPHPAPAFEPAMRIEVPDGRLTAQWKLGAWHILRRSEKGADSKWRFADYPYGILAAETYMILRALDLQGMHREAADGLDQWLGLPLAPKVVPGQGGHHEWAIPDHPLGHFADGVGCLTHAEGIAGAGGHMDGVHCMGPGAIMFALTEHFLLTGDRDWLKAHAPRMKANAEWMLRQRRLLAANLPGGERLWSKGLQPAHVVTPDSMRMHMQFYESEAYYWLAVSRMARLLADIDLPAARAMADEAEAYRKDLLAAIDRSIALTPVVAVRDGTYRSFIPFAPHVRGFATGAWGWRRCQGHVGAIYWDTVQSADPLVSPAGLLSPRDPRVQGHLDVLEDRLLLENTKIREKVPAFDPEKDWFSRASWQYQCGLERHANIHLAADDPPNAIRSMLNQYAVEILPGEYVFREHTTGGPPDKIYEESCFLERLRGTLVHEADGALWLARATPRAWLEPGKKIVVKDAPTHFGPVSCSISAEAGGDIAAVVDLPSRSRPVAVFLRLRHPKAAPMREVTVDGAPWSEFDRDAETVRLPRAASGSVAVRARY